MKIRFYIDPESERPHIYRHDVSEAEVEDVLQRGEKTVRVKKDREWPLGALPEDVF